MTGSILLICVPWFMHTIHNSDMFDEHCSFPLAGKGYSAVEWSPQNDSCLLIYYLVSWIRSLDSRFSKVKSNLLELTYSFAWRFFIFIHFAPSVRFASDGPSIHKCIFEAWKILRLTWRNPCSKIYGNLRHSYVYLGQQLHPFLVRL